MTSRPFSTCVRPLRPRHAGLTLIELMMAISVLVVLSGAMLGSVAGVDAHDAVVREQLRAIRAELAEYRLRHRRAPDLVARQWADLNLPAPPRNPLHDLTTVAASPGPGVGWVWYQRRDGSFQLYPTNRTGLELYRSHDGDDDDADIDDGGVDDDEEDLDDIFGESDDDEDDDGDDDDGDQPAASTA